MAHEAEHHHKETFITKYIFSQDHKMIAKQYLITGLIMGFIGIAMSLLFRMQLAWPGEASPVFKALLGKWAPDGVMDADIQGRSSWSRGNTPCQIRSAPRCKVR